MFLIQFSGKNLFMATQYKSSDKLEFTFTARMTNNFCYAFGNDQNDSTDVI